MGAEDLEAVPDLVRVMRRPQRKTGSVSGQSPPRTQEPVAIFARIPAWGDGVELLVVLQLENDVRSTCDYLAATAPG
jgi:hypothetical protein